MIKSFKIFENIDDDLDNELKNYNIDLELYKSVENNKIGKIRGLNFFD